MKYFENFPSTIYTFDKNTVNQQLVTNIFARSRFLKEISENTDIAYEYNIKEGDTPDIIADKVYGDSNRYWIILLFNKISNPYYEFPMKNDVLETYITKKYSQTLNESQSTIHHYEKQITKTTTSNGTVLSKEVTTTLIGEYEVNFTNNNVTETSLPTIADTSLVISTETVSYPTYILTIETTHKAVSNYTYEFTENEKRRRIKILDAQYISRIENEFKEIMING